MTKQTETKTWTRPQLEVLGKLEDVAPNTAGAGEGGSGKS